MGDTQAIPVSHRHPAVLQSPGSGVRFASLSLSSPVTSVSLSSLFPETQTSVVQMQIPIDLGCSGVKCSLLTAEYSAQKDKDAPLSLLVCCELPEI